MNKFTHPALNIAIGKGDIGGKALYAARDFKKGEVVLARYVNHSEDPNVVLDHGRQDFSKGTYTTDESGSVNE